MTVETSVNIGGTFIDIDDCKVNPAGTYKQVTSIKANVAGTWETVWKNLIVTLTGAVVRQIDGLSPYNSNAGIRFLADGTVETGKSKNGDAIVWTQASASTDWIIPNGEASADYDVRFTNYVDGGDGDVFTTLAAAINVWIDLGTTRTWILNDAAINAGNGFSVDFEIRDPGATTVATGTYTFEVENFV